MKIEHRPVTIKISHLDDFKLEVKEQLYELDENDEDLSHEECLCLRYQTIQHERDVETKLWMLIYLSKKIVVSPDVWMVIVKDLNQNPKSVKAVISNRKEQDMIFMLSEGI